MTTLSRRDLLLTVLGAFFVTNAIVAELIGGKLIQAGPFVMSVGVIPWPAVFLATDMINEYYGRRAVRRLTLLTITMIVYAFVIVFAAMAVPAAGMSPVGDDAFGTVFGLSLWILAGSLCAFAASQLIDVVVFWAVRDRTGGRLLWARATGSTVVSQLVDTFVILGIAFWLPGKLATADFLRLAATNYSYKLVIAVALTPFLYLLHHVIDRYLGAEEAGRLVEEAAAASRGLEL